MDVFIVSEDAVTNAVLKRIIKDYNTNLNIIGEFPARGGQIKKDIYKYNNLSLSYSVILLTDLDVYECPPVLITDFCKNFDKSINFYIRVAIDEAEAWLMAEKEGFAKYFKVSKTLIPNNKIVNFKNSKDVELDFPYKSSSYFMMEIISKSSNLSFRNKLMPRNK